MTGPAFRFSLSRSVLLVIGGAVVGALLTAGVVSALSDSDSPPQSAGPDSASSPAAVPEVPSVASDLNGESDATDDSDPADPAVVPPPNSGPSPPTGDISGVQVSCPAPTVTVSSSDGLTAALNNAHPGDSIALADGTYKGAFVATVSGSEAAPIFLCGGAGAVLTGAGPKSGYGFHLDGVQYWRLVGFTVRNSQKGVMADHTANSVIQGLTVEQIGDEGIHLRSASTFDMVLGNTVRQTGLRRDKFGEGIYVGSAESNWEKYGDGGPDLSDNNLVQGNSVSQTTSENIDIKEGTSGGKLIGNVLDGTGMSAADSLVDVKGSNWLIQGNVGTHAPSEGIQTHNIVDDWGSHNVFRANVIDVDGGGNEIYINKPEDTGNQVFCDNRSSSGGPLKSNVSCTN